MIHSRLLVVFGATLVLLGTTAYAADFCIRTSPFTTTQYVGKNFKIPGKGKCKAWNGVYLPDFANVSVTTGTACTASDGSVLRLHLVSMRETVAFNDYIVLPLPSLTGGTLDEVVAQFGPTLLHLDGISGGECNPKKMPIP